MPVSLRLLTNVEYLKFLMYPHPVCTPPLQVSMPNPVLQFEVQSQFRRSWQPGNWHGWLGWTPRCRPRERNFCDGTLPTHAWSKRWSAWVFFLSLQTQWRRRSVREGWSSDGRTSPSRIGAKRIQVYPASDCENEWVRICKGRNCQWITWIHLATNQGNENEWIRICKGRDCQWITWIHWATNQGKSRRDAPTDSI